MQNYRENDYAFNRFHSGIVYKFVDSVVEITLDDYLRENPDKSENDFKALKQLSDDIYFQQDRERSRQTRKNLSIHMLEETESFCDGTLEDRYIEEEERSWIVAAVKSAFHSGLLTEVQIKRFYIHIYQGMSARQIAAAERVSHVNVSKSIKAAKEKIKKFLEEG